MILRRVKDSDVTPFLAYRNDPEVARYQAWDSCTKREARAMIEELESLQPGTPGEWFQFAIELPVLYKTPQARSRTMPDEDLQEVRSEWVMPS